MDETIPGLEYLRLRRIALARRRTERAIHDLVGLDPALPFDAAAVAVAVADFDEGILLDLRELQLELIDLDEQRDRIERASGVGVLVATAAGRHLLPPPDVPVAFRSLPDRAAAVREAVRLGAGFLMLVADGVVPPPDALRVLHARLMARPEVEAIGGLYPDPAHPAEPAQQTHLAGRAPQSMPRAARALWIANAGFTDGLTLYRVHPDGIVASGEGCFYDADVRGYWRDPATGVTHTLRATRPTD